MKKLIPLLLLVGLCGCGPGYDYEPYVGAQQNWQTKPGSYVRTVDHVMIYSEGEYPERPYLILGSVKGGSEHDIAKAVRDQGGDAAMIFSDRTVRSGSVAIAGPGIIFNQPLRRTIVTGQVIKYK